MNDTPLDVGQEIEWLSRPTHDGYLHGTVVQIGARKVKIKIQSPKTGEYKEKWAEPQYLRRVEAQDE